MTNNATIPELLGAANGLSQSGASLARSVGPVLGKSRIDRAHSDIAALESGLEQYSFDMFNYPGADTGLAALKTPPSGAKADQYRPGGYIKRIQQDPWGNDYHYTVPGPRSGGAYDVFSAGPDGEPGNEDDIGNWN